MGVAIAFLLQTQSAAAATEMTTGGWIFMAGAWIGIISLAVFCFSKILRGSNNKP